MHKTNEIKEVREIKVHCDRFYYRTSETIFLNGKVPIKLEDKFFGTFYPRENELIVQFFKGYFEIYNQQGFLLNSIKGYYNYLIPDRYVFFLESESKKVKALAHADEVLFRKNGYQIGPYYLILENLKIETYSFIDGKLLWIFDASIFGNYSSSTFGEEKPHQISQFIGVWQNQLIILLTGGKFISLNIENGKLIWEKNEVAKNLTNQSINYGFGEPYHPFLDQDKGRVYILQGEVFIDFDLTTLEATYVWNVKDHQKEDFLFFRQSRIFNNQIYFTAFRDSNKGVDDTVGVFDIEKKEIIWQYTFQFDKGIFIPNSQDNIQVNETNLYVLDSSKTLHIFQK